MPSPEACATAANIVNDVLHHGHSLDSTAAKRLKPQPAESHSEIREIAWGSVRWAYRYRHLLQQKLHKPIRSRDTILENLLLCAFYQYEHLDAPDYAITSGAVEAASLLGRKHAKNLVNGVLRAHLRDPVSITTGQEEAQYATPMWLLSCLRKAWPDDWNDIVNTYNSRPPLTLRANIQLTSRSDYMLRLLKAGVDSTASSLSQWAITLAKPRSVLKVPGFSDGLVSVQDAAAQLSPCFLGPLQGLRILDACAAPGGKTGQLYELATDSTSITAIDLPGRTHLIHENIQRLKGHVDIIGGDVTEPDRWWDGTPYDRIILDAPCSGTGVIRRHPDIRVLRRHSDIARFSCNQLNMIQQLWPLLCRGGRLLYITCSILPAENDAVIERLMENTKDAGSVPSDYSLGESTRFGRQFLPCAEGDGLYYAIVQKC